MASGAHTSELLARHGVRHGFFGRRGGVSKGVYDALNCGPHSGDAQTNVAENRARVSRHFGLPAESLCTLRQVHGDQVVVVTRPWAIDQAPRADGLVTHKANIILGILSADCVPVLFYDPDQAMIGAAHAGWKGALAGIGTAVIETMAQHGSTPANIVAAIGPHIARASYEVGPEVYEAFAAANSASARYFAPSKKAGHFLLDLDLAITEQLHAAGVNQISRLGLDTYTHKGEFFSYRRNTHEGLQGYGRQVSAITLGDENGK